MKIISCCVLLLSVQIMSGCALFSNVGNLAPIPSQEQFRSFSERVTGPDPALSTFKNALTGFIGDYHKLASDRRAMEWDATGMTTVGGIAAVLGALADKTGLMNTGAGVAGLGLMASSRYNFAQQSLVYFGAVKKLSCVHSKVAGISNTVLDDAKQSPDANAAKIADGAMKDLIVAVDTVRIEAVNGILGIAPGVPTRDELLAMFKHFLQPAAGAAAPPVGADALRKQEAGETIKKALTEVNACVKMT